MAPERRRHGRYRLWLPAQLTCEGEELMAVGHDMGRHGALLVTELPLEVGAAIHIRVRIPPEDGLESSLEARVLRCQPNAEDPSGLWPYEVAVSFVHEAPEIEERLRDLVAELGSPLGG